MQLAPSALHATAEALAHLLGPWEITEPDADGIVHLFGPFERHIGMRLLHDGSTIQLWATGGTQPAPLPDTESQPDGARPLPYGHRWHTCAHIGSLTADQDPAVELFTTINDDLLPVFDTKPARVGHRPWQPEENDDVDPDDVEETVQAAAAADVDLDDAPTQEPDTPDRSHKLAQASWRTGARRYAEAQGVTPEQAREFGHWYIEQGHESPKDAPLEALYAQWRDLVPDAPRDDQAAPDTTPQPEPEPSAKRTATRNRRKTEAPTTAKPKPGAPRKRTAKPAGA